MIEFIRKHHQFPTREEVKNNLNLAYSDHLMLLTKIPLGKDRKPLNIITLNMLGGLTCSGIHPASLKLEHNEREKLGLERCERIAEGLKKGIDANDVDIILLQEIDTDIEGPLQKTLGSDWVATHTALGLYNLYNKNRLELQGEDIITNSVPSVAKIRSLTFTDKQNDAMSIDIHNLWGIFNNFPLAQEEACRKVLNKNSKSKISVIVGDTNSRIAPIDGQPRNITTGVIPSQFHPPTLSEDYQMTDFPDGGFYRDEENKIHQLTTEVLDFKKGTIVGENLDENKADISDIHNDYRMIMCLDETYQSKIVIDAQTIFEYEQTLKDRLNAPDIMVRMASDSFNNKAVGIRFPINLPIFSYIQENLTNEEIRFGFQVKENEASENKFDCVFIPLGKQELLHTVINNYYRVADAYKKHHANLNTLVENLKKLTSDCSKKIGPSRPAYKILTDLNNILKDDGMYSVKKIEKFYSYLQDKTNGKENINIVKEDKSKAVGRFIAGVVAIAAIILTLPLGLAVMGLVYAVAKKLDFEAKLPHHLLKSYGKKFAEKLDELKPSKFTESVFFKSALKDEEETQEKNDKEIKKS